MLSHPRPWENARGLTSAGSGVLLLIGWLTARGWAETATPRQIVTLKVPDMFCGGCEVAVRIVAKKVDGVKDVKTSSAAPMAEVSFDPSRTTAAAIASGITKHSGFKVDVQQTHGLRPPA